MKKINFLMLFAFVFLLFSCKTELGDTESTRNTSQATGASKISFRDFTKTTGTSLDKIQKISEAINLEPNKGMKSSLAEFNIDTAYVKKLIYGNNETSFTIKAYKNNENPFNIFYNIVYHKVDGQWKAEVFKYTYAKEWLENYNVNPKIPFSGNIQYIKTANLDISAGRIYTCAYTVQTLCYCADHTPGQCKGCSAGFRDVAVLDCSEEQTGGGTTISGNPSLGAPPYNDPPMGGGLGTSLPNPYTNGFQYDPSMPEFDEIAFRENNIRYQTWETFGSDWIQLHSDLYYKIEAYQVAKKSVDFGFSTNLVYNYPNEFVNWAFDFLLQNTMTSQAQFQNWFMDTSEGQDGEYVNNLDDILNTLQYQIKQMPNYSNFVNAFPKQDYPGYPGYYKQLPASQVYPQVGGILENLYNTNGQDTGPYRNACTVRLSLAMNRLGYYIPNNELSRKGAIVNGNQWYYYLQAKTAGDFMQKTFGNPTHKLEGSDANDPNKVAKFLEGKTGIYVIVNNNHKPTSQGGAGYTGHVDLIQNGHIPGGANAYNVPGGIKSIRIWEFTP